MTKLKLIIASRATWMILGSVAGALGGEKAQMVVNVLGQVLAG